MESKTSQRLYIDSIEFKNFKSFANKIHVGPFHTSFNSIIGPNGSGKSNVLDGLLFVFGKRTNQIRLKKLSELIHNSTSTDSTSSPTSAYVKVNFDFASSFSAGASSPGDTPASDDTPTPVDRAPFSVKREAYSNNTSRYFLNNKLSRFSEISAHLLSHGLDLSHSRFIILQGEIDSISLMKPKAAKPSETGLLEYLEDLVGTSAAVPGILEKEKALADLEEEKATKSKKLRVAEEDVRVLEAQKETAVKSAVDRASFFKVSESAAILEEVQLKSKMEELNRSQQSKLSAMETLKKDKEAADKGVQELKQKARTLSSELEKESAEMNSVSAKMQKLEFRDLKLREGLKLVSKERESLEKKTKETQTGLEQKEKEVAEASRDKKETEERMAKVRREKESVSAKLRKVLGSVQKSEELSELMARKSRLVEQYSPVEKEKTQLEFARKAVEKKVNAFFGSLSKVTDRLKKLEGEKTKVAKKLEEAKQELTDKTEEAGELSKLVEKKSVQLDSLNQDSESLLSKRNQLRSELRELEHAIQRAKDSSTFEKAIETLKSTRKGVFGRLGDLVSVPAKYDVAASVSTGNWDFILVNTTETAIQCVKYLREQRAGFATFLALDKQESQENVRRMDRAFRPPADSERLFDLLEPLEARFRPAVYAAVGNTLVAANIDLASSINNGIRGGGDAKYRIVTLNGELLEKSGAMTGGGKGAPAKGKVLVKADGCKRKKENHAQENKQKLVKDKEAIADRLDKLEKELGLVQKESQKTSDLLEKARASQITLQGPVESLEKLVASLSASLEESQRSLAIERARYTETNESLAKSKAELDSLEGKLRSLETSNAPLSSAIKAVEKEISAFYGKEYTELQARLQGLSKELDRLVPALASLTEKEITLAAAIKEQESKMGDLKRDLERAASKQMSISKEQKDLEKEALELIDQSEKLEGSIREKNLGVKNCKREMEAKVNEGERVSKELKGLKKELEAFEGKMGNLRKSVSAAKEGGKKWARLYGKVLEMLRGFGEEKVLVELEKALKRVETGVTAKSEKDKIAKEPEEAPEHLKDKEGVEAKKEEQGEKEPSEPCEEGSRKESGENLHSAMGEQEKESISSEASKLLEKGNYWGYLERSLQACSPSWSSSDLAPEVSAKLQDLVKSLHSISKKASEDSSTSIKVIEDFYSKKHDLELQQAEFERLRGSVAALKEEKNALVEKRLREFQAAFKVIQSKTREIYRLLTLGGEAELEFVDALDPFSEGIQYSVRPPNKSWKRIQNLSGGEKTLSSLSLVFALHAFKTAPIYIMDEVDAALDFKNVSITGSFIKRVSKDAQFIVVSLRSNMFELADKLAGIYKTFNQSKTLTFHKENKESVI